MSAGTPSSLTVALAVALMGISKTPMLRTLDIPGSWDEGGIAEVLHVDHGKEFKAQALERGAARYGTIVHLEYQYSPWQKPYIERFWRTINSDIHTWPGTTLSNPQELKRHGGRKELTMTFAQANRRLMLAVMEYNHETYDGPELPPVAQWAKFAGTPALARRVPQNPQQYFIDLLPSEERELKFTNARDYKIQGVDATADLASRSAWRGRQARSRLETRHESHVEPFTIVRRYI